MEEWGMTGIVGGTVVDDLEGVRVKTSMMA